jgi:uncharacterized protein YjdB
MSLWSKLSRLWLLAFVLFGLLPLTGCSGSNGGALSPVGDGGSDAEFDANPDAVMGDGGDSGMKVIALQVTPANPTLAAGTMQQFKATADLSDGSTMDVSATAAWSSGDTTIATVNASGQASGVKAGTATITARYMNVSGTSKLTVTAATLKTITVTPANPSIVAGLTQQLTATGTFSDGTAQDITMTATWASGTTATATISNAGLATAKAAGMTAITATQMGITGKTNLTVTAATLTSIQVTPNPGTTNIGGATVQFKATGNFSDGTAQDITTMATWFSSNTALAKIGAMTGLATPASTGIPGNATITAAFLGRTGSAVLIVNNATLTSLDITPLNGSIAAGTTQQFAATGHYSDGSSADVTSQTMWQSSTTTVATIDGTGLAKAVAVGMTTISASFGGLTQSTGLTVTAATITGLSISPNPGQTYLGGPNVQFTATATYSNTTTQNVTTSATWSSNNNAIATVGAMTGLAAPGTTTAGTVTITAMFMGQTATATLVVGSAQITALNVTPPTASIAAATTQQFTATATYSNGSSQNVTSSATWQSSDPTKATIDPAGLATAVATTMTPVTITATFGGKQATAQLSVL